MPHLLVTERDPLGSPHLRAAACPRQCATGPATRDRAGRLMRSLGTAPMRQPLVRRAPVRRQRRGVPIVSAFATRYRSHTCAEAARAPAGENVKVAGRASGPPRGKDAVLTVSDPHGSIEVSLADRPELQESLAAITAGSVLQVDGVLEEFAAERADEPPRRRIRATRAQLLAGALPLPIETDDAGEARTSREDRLRYRYLDLRRPAMRHRLAQRSRLVHAIRTHLHEHGFVELETPALAAYSPDATTAFVVPREPGRCYALAETPQLYKQLLMAGDCDRYFQITRCFRNEPRFGPMHQPEFTVLDLEMAYVDEPDVYERFDALIAHVLEQVWDIRIELPIRRMTYQQAMAEFGSSRPDLRFSLPFRDVTEALRGAGGPFFEQALLGKGKESGMVRAAVLGAEHVRDSSDPALGELVAPLQAAPAGVRAVRVGTGKQLEGPAAKGIGKAVAARVVDQLGLKPGDVVVLIAHADPGAVAQTIGLARGVLAERAGLVDPDAPPSLVWVTEFPFFEYDPATGAWGPARHPFCQPHPEDRELLKGAGALRRRPAVTEGEEIDRGKDFGAGAIFPDDPPARRELAKVRSKSYELVLNGEELLSGSIRNHELRVQERIFAMFGFDREEVERRYGPLMEAFRYGLPPHGGASLGLDRLLARMEKRTDLIDVIPFPKDAHGREPMTGAPSPIDPELLRALLEPS
ncbi:MAG: hypothetical protein D6776_07715 [Planctomycetota bacterium]|nr:MAG: hypothetical protein D6776_07715 [Planctomycetota bacterium]